MADKQKVLVVDDQQTICDGVTRILKKRGWEVDGATDGQEAIDRLDRNSFDMVIADLMMPRVSGMDLLRYVRENHPDVPVVMITGYASIDSAVEATKVGAAGYVPKPFTPDELLEVVEKAAATHAAIPARPKEEDAGPGPIDADEPFDRTAVADATSEAYADGLTRTDLPGKGPAAQKGYCPKGEMVCKKYAKQGVMCKGECPILKARARKAAKNLGLAARVEGFIDVDMPFSFDEVAEVTGPAYAAMAGPDGIPIRYREEQDYAESRNILVIDDEAVVCNSLRRILGRQGHTVEQAMTADEGLAKLGAKDYDLVLLDLRMPGRNGIEVLQAIKDLRPDVKVIVVTGYASIESAIEATRLGASQYIAKPFTPQELVKATNDAFEQAAA